MARYVKDFPTCADAQAIHNDLYGYLTAEGYEYIQYDGENVFKKGQGFVSGPTFFKFTYYENFVRMETWMKMAFLPGVYIGELELEGFVGSAGKGPWKKRVKQIELMFNNYTSQSIEQQPMDDVMQSNFNQGMPQNNICIAPDSVQLPPPGCPVSRKEFIENYAQPSVKKDIKTIAIICYVCAGITFAFSCIINPAGIIDALVLAGLALGMHLGKSKVCAILILILSIVECVAGLMAGSVPFWWLIAGVYAVVTFNKVDKQYKQFLNR